MFIADLHIHSHFSRATSRDLTPELLDWWARRKGIQVVGTGDFTHPGWRQELAEKLIPAEEGLYRLREDCRRLDYALDLAQNLHCYHFMPRDMDLADYGKELAKRDGIYPKDELLASCFDAEGYANQRMKRMGLSAAEHGFVSWNGTELNFEYSQPEMEPTMSM